MEKYEKGIIYAYSVMYKGQRVEWAYIGKTKRQLIIRHDEHLRNQYWSDLYPEVRIVKEFNNCYAWWLSLVEWYYIKTKKPIFNQEHNFKNKKRIPRTVQKIERANRELAKKGQSYG